MPSVGPEAASTKDEAVHPPRDSHRQTSHSGGESAPVARFDQQMQMIGLHRKLHDSKRATVALIRVRDGTLQRGKDEPCS